MYAALGPLWQDVWYWSGRGSVFFVGLADTGGGVGQGGLGVCCARAEVVGWLYGTQAAAFPEVCVGFGLTL